SAAIAELPPHAHVLILGRALPEFSLAELVVQERAAVLDASDLKFDDRETAALAQLRGVHLSDAAVLERCGRCEGWRAGVALSVNVGAKALPSSAGSQPAVFAYLLDQNIAT